MHTYNRSIAQGMEMAVLGLCFLRKKAVPHFSVDRLDCSHSLCLSHHHTLLTCSCLDSSRGS